jgi:amidohydrolase
VTDPTDEFKALVCDAVDRVDDRLVSISDTIHQHPELGLKEYRACELLTTELSQLGFETQVGIAGMDTAFSATVSGDKPGPRIAFLAEYDALPELGHACGHNVIAASAVGAALALRKVVSELGGTVVLYGTPDEEAVAPESRGGKVIMARAGLFDDLDAVLMVHPTGGESAVWRYSFPLKDFTVSFTGKPAHYTVPHEGVNALESLLLFLSAVNTVKRGWPSNVMFAYTITDGGGPSPIVVPARAEAHIAMKAFHSGHLEDLFERVCACARNTARMTGAEARIQTLGAYRNTIPNLALSFAMRRNMQKLGEAVQHPAISQKKLERLTYQGISTDFGDVSWRAPAIHAYCSLGGSDLVAHTAAFAAAAGSDPGHRAVIMSAKAMASTAVDILTDPALAKEVKAEFTRYRKDNFLQVPGIPPGYLPFPPPWNGEAPHS